MKNKFDLRAYYVLMLASFVCYIASVGFIFMAGIKLQYAFILPICFFVYVVGFDYESKGYKAKKDRTIYLKMEAFAGMGVVLLFVLYAINRLNTLQLTLWLIPYLTGMLYFLFSFLGTNKNEIE